MPGFPTSIGNPPPDSAGAGPGKRVYSGEGGLTASCRVKDTGGGNFSISGSMQAPSNHITFNVEGSSAGAMGTATISLATPALETSVASPPSMPCTLTIIPTTTGLGIEPGRVWSHFECKTLVGNPNPICAASGEFIYENCSK